VGIVQRLLPAKHVRIWQAGHPVKIKLSFFAVEKALKEVRDAWQPAQPRDNADLDARVDGFVASLNG
jgi:hypothetical protein